MIAAGGAAVRAVNNLKTLLWADSTATGIWGLSDRWFFINGL